MVVVVVVYTIQARASGDCALRRRVRRYLSWKQVEEARPVLWRYACRMRHINCPGGVNTIRRLGGRGRGGEHENKK
jgi:hypothetical protein